MIATSAKKAFLTGRPRVQTRWVLGRHERLRYLVFSVKAAIFLGLPWLQVGGYPALLFDVTRRRFHVFGQVIWPQDFYLLGLFLAFAAMMLFATTALMGRVWCGFACPHTLLTTLFMGIDRLIEGDRPARLALDAGKGTPAGYARRALKHLVWVGVAAIFGFGFTAYFFGALPLLEGLPKGAVPVAAWGLFAVITAVTYLFAGHLRDWVCVTSCPYGRFQSVMQDDDSLLVTFDRTRGEPRGKGKEIMARGGCVDCGQCVTACPMGIDIRNGYQYECISCMRCVDACDDTMARIKAPPSLIKLASARQLATGEPARKPWQRPRLYWYATVLLALAGTWTTLMATRPLFGIEANRDRQVIPMTRDGQMANMYTLALLNKDVHAHALRVALAGLNGQLVLGENPVRLASGGMQQENATVIVKAKKLETPTPRPFQFLLYDAATGRMLGQAPATFFEAGGTP